MYSILSSLKGIIKTDEVVIDNPVFKLHYRLTSIILIGFSVIVSTNQFFGSPISCFTANHEIPDNVINNYCWIQSTFTLPGAHNKIVGVEVPHPGIDKYTPDGQRVFHQYYQWVVFYLFFQAGFFYIPRYIWKIFEGNKIRQILLGLSNPIVSPDDKLDKLTKLAQYLFETLGSHTCYAYAYFACELLNFVNVVSQIYMTDAFLGGEFTSYGSQVISFSQMDQQNRSDPMVRVFPRVTKCTFHKFGPSGDVQKHDALCVLPINILNEKIFVFLWFWFVLLAVISGLMIAYRIPIIVLRKLRIRVLSMRNRFADRDELYQIVNRSTVGDWLVMHLLGKNMNSLNYKDLVKKFEELIHADNMQPNGSKDGSNKKLMNEA